MLEHVNHVNAEWMSSETCCLLCLGVQDFQSGWLKTQGRVLWRGMYLVPFPGWWPFLAFFCYFLFPHSTRVSYFAVFDGHGGVRASKFAAQNLHQNLIKKFPKGKRSGVRAVGQLPPFLCWQWIGKLICLGVVLQYSSLIPRGLERLLCLLGKRAGSLFGTRGQVASCDSLNKCEMCCCQFWQCHFKCENTPVVERFVSQTLHIHYCTGFWWGKPRMCPSCSAESRRCTAWLNVAWAKGQTRIDQICFTWSLVAVFLSDRWGSQRGENCEEMPFGHLQTHRWRVSKAGIQPVSANAFCSFLFLSMHLWGLSSEQGRGNLPCVMPVLWQNSTQLRCVRLWLCQLSACYN